MLALEREILVTLTHKVRLLTLQQIARTWWSHTRRPVANARRKLRDVVAADMLQELSVNARPEIPLRRPVLSWQVGEPRPAFGKLAYRLQSRWKEAPTRATVYVATRKSAKVFGGKGGKLKNVLQAGHDLHLSAIYLAFLRDNPGRADAWMSEDKLAPFRRHQKLPDAVIGNSAHEIELVIEFGNGYDAKRVEDFHRDCAERGLPYELW